MVIVILVALGLCFGSFVNALVWRIYQQSLPKKKRAASDAELSVSKGRSMCPHCKHTLAAQDLVPLFSWLWLHGKCRYCHKSIGIQYPLVEAATAILFVVSYFAWPVALQGRGLFEFVVWLPVVVGFVALIIYDLRWMLLPDRIVFPLIGLGVVQTLAVAVLFGGGVRAVIQAVLGLLIAGGIFYVLFQVSDGKWIGGGDVKLGYAIGLVLGAPGLAFLMIFVASLLGTLVAIPGLISQKLSKTSKLPFGPFLIVATILVKLFGTAVIDWYMRQLGI